MRIRRGRAAFFAALVLLASPAAHAGNILVNGSFDDIPLGTGWTQISNPLYPLIVGGSDLPPGVAAQSPPNIVWMGGILDYADAIYQDVNVPAGTTKLTLSGYVWIRSDEVSTVPFDNLYAELLTPGNVLLEVLHHWSNSDENLTWASFSFDAAGNHAGSLIRFRFRSTNDASYATSFFIDTCVLDATSVVAVEPSHPRVSRLVAAGPNPTRAGSRWRLDLAAPAMVHAGIHDLEGRLVHCLADQSFVAGSHDLAWDGADARGVRVAPGIYFCVVSVDGRALQQRIALIH
jgi:hypothetical protein